MDFVKTVTSTFKTKINHVKHPFSNVENILKIRKEKLCWFCRKKFKDCDFIGLAFTDKGNKLCCDECSLKFSETIENEKKTVT